MATSGSGASHRVRIAMLGGFRVAVDGRTVPDGSWGRDRATRLLKVLSLKEGHTASREELIRDLRILADREQDELLRRTAAQANAKLGLRRAAQEEDDPHLWIVAPRQGQRAFRANELWTDVAAFEGLYAIPAAARTLAHYREAIELYAGDLLQDDREMERLAWVTDLRTQLRRQFADLLRALWGHLRDRPTEGDTGVVCASALARLDGLARRASLSSNEQTLREALRGLVEEATPIAPRSAAEGSARDAPQMSEDTRTTERILPRAITRHERQTLSGLILTITFTLQQPHTARYTWQQRGLRNHQITLEIDGAVEFRVTLTGDLPIVQHDFTIDGVRSQLFVERGLGGFGLSKQRLLVGGLALFQKPSVPYFLAGARPATPADE